MFYTFYQWKHLGTTFRTYLGCFWACILHILLIWNFWSLGLGGKYLRICLRHLPHNFLFISMLQIKLNILDRCLGEQMVANVCLVIVFPFSVFIYTLSVYTHNDCVIRRKCTIDLEKNNYNYILFWTLSATSGGRFKLH